MKKRARYKIVGIICSSFTRGKEAYIFLIAFICIEKLSNKSSESNETDYLSGELGVGSRRMGDRNESKTFHLSTFYSDF